MILSRLATLDIKTLLCLKRPHSLTESRVTFWPTEDSDTIANQQRVAAVVPQAALPLNFPSTITVGTRPNPVIANPVIDGSSAAANITLGQLQEHYRLDLDRMVRELDSLAHFVTYAAPAFIEFRKGRYLQLSVIATLSDQPAGSQYQLAALSFDKHIAHIIRPVLSYLEDAQDFDGIDFSATIRLGFRL